MSGYEKYVEQAAEASYQARSPVWEWDRLTPFEREPRIAQMRAALAAIGPLIEEDTRDRMVTAAGRALERDGGHATACGARAQEAYERGIKATSEGIANRARGFATETGADVVDIEWLVRWCNEEAAL